MARYIFIRDFYLKHECEDYFFIQKGSKVHLNDASWSLYDSSGKDISNAVSISLVDIFDEMRIYLFALDADLFKTAFNSFPYSNWLKEKASDIDDNGDPLYPNLAKTPETMIMYLMELGVSSDTIMRYMYGPENKYLEYRYLVQEFGKML